MKNGSEQHGKGGEKKGPATQPVKQGEQKVVPPPRGNQPDPFAGNRKK
jgi:hypothetical protein